MQARADARGQTDSVDTATVGDARRAVGWNARWKRNRDGRVAPEEGTHYLL
jgi:hypothetical protein